MELIYEGKNFDQHKLKTLQGGQGLNGSRNWISLSWIGVGLR